MSRKSRKGDLFLGSTSRNRVWTYNFLTKTVCFSVFSSFYCVEKANEKLSFFQHFLRFSSNFLEKKLSEIDSKRTFLENFLGSTSRNRVWTYNFLTKNLCFSVFSSFYCVGKANEKLSFFQHFLRFSSNFFEKNCRKLIQNEPF